MGIYTNSFNRFSKITRWGGLAIRVVNDTGETSVEGKVVEPSTSVLRGVSLAGVGDPDPIGIILDAGVPNGLEMWITINGFAKVLFVNATVMEQFARTMVSGDTSPTAGLAIAEAVPSPPFATDKHFQEVGHILETIGAPGLALVNLHWN